MIGRALWVGLGAMVLAAVTACATMEEDRMGSDRSDTAAENAALLEEGDQAFRRREVDAARAIYERAAAATGPEEAHVEALAQVARMYSIGGDEAAGRPWLERAGALARPDEPLGWSRYQLVRGVYERESGRRAAACATFESLYDYCLEREMPLRAIDPAHMVALAADDVAAQIEWAHKGIAAAEAGGAEGWLAVLWNNLGWTFEGEGRYAEALAALEKARHYHRRTGGEMEKMIADFSVAKLLRLNGRRTQARALLLDTTEWAQRLYDEQPVADRLEWVGTCRLELGELELGEGRVELGRELLRQGRAILVEAGIERWGAGWLKEIDALIDQVRALAGGED